MSTEIVNPNAQGFSLQWPSVEEAQAFASGGGSPTSDVVYKPAGPAVPGLVFTTWASAIAALLTKQPGATLWVVGSGGVIDASVASSLASYQLRAMTPATILDIANGVTLATLPGIIDGVWLRSLNTNAAVPVVQLASGATVQLRGNAQLWQFGAGGLFLQGGAVTGVSFLFNGVSGWFTSGAGVLLDISNAGFSGTLNINDECSLFGTNHVTGAAGSLLVNLCGQGGSSAGFVVPPFTGTLQWNDRTRRVIPLGGGTLPGAVGLNLGFAFFQQSAAPTGPVSDDVELTDQRRIQRVVVEVLSNTMAATTRIEATMDGVAMVPPVYVDVPAGATGKRLGTRVNALGSNWTSYGNSAGLAVQASCTAGGVGNAIQFSAAVEYT